ncbi:transcription factor Adf-1-like [Paramuricea clavata]|uniref:Transcription factor Adf-1-like n=1 Tax=Paramuricea clavata TaxID=317549 RepID=A0A6S7FVY5_PARCT|nr:transcription factor Adf-1-like [Paramuricea clavata]
MQFGKCHFARKRLAILVQSFSLGETAKKKWTNIRDAFQNNWKKNTSKSGDGAKKNIRCYKYAGILGFLIPFIQNRETSTNLDTPEEGSDSVGNGQEELERSDDEDSLLSTDTSASSTPSPGLSQSLGATPSSSIASYSSRKRRQNSTENAVDLSIVEYLKSRKTIPDKPDEITEFFNSMAISVKKIPELQQAVVKFKIHQIVHEMEILFAKPHPKHQTGLLSQQPHIQTGPIQTGPQSNQFSHPPYQVSQGMPQHHQFQQSTSL